MPEGRIDLEEGLLDSPQVRSQVGKIEKCLGPHKEYTSLLKDTFQACNIHQEKVCEGTEALSKLLTAFQSEVMGSQETFMPKAFFRLSRYLSELHSCQEMLSTQLENAVIELLSQFITNDFGKLEKLKDNYETAMQEHEQATMKYSRVPKRKDSDKVRFEANSDLFGPRRKFFESSLDYFAELNCFEHKKKFALLEPLLTFMHAQMAYFKVGHEILNKELGTLLTDLNTEVQRFHDSYQKEMSFSREVKADIELQFPIICIPDLDPTDPFTDQPLLPNTSLTSKAGYLFIRTQSGFPSKWDRIYFFTKKGCLYLQIPPKSPELIVHLKGAEVSPTELDDRRYVFVVNHSSLKRPIYLLAESDLQKDEWIATINNISYDRDRAQPRSNTQRDESVIRSEREKIRSWVNKEIDPKKEKTSLPKLPKATPTFSKTTPTTPSTFSLPSFLNFLDPTNQSDHSSSSSSSTRHSPLSQRKTSAADHTLSREEKKKMEENASVPPSLPPQPEELTTGTTPTEAAPTSSTTGKSRIGFSKRFFVKYLGHMEVQEGRNINVIMDTIQKVQSARALKNVREAQVIEITITHRSITLYDHYAKKWIGQMVLRDILRCAVQPESAKLFGIVNRTSGEGDKSKFLCHVMESDQSGSRVCTAINEAIQVAIKILQSTSSGKHSRSKSQEGGGGPGESSKHSSKNEVDPLIKVDSSSSLKYSTSNKAFSQHHKSTSDTSLVTMGGAGTHTHAPPLVSSSSKSSLASTTSEGSINEGPYFSATPLTIPSPMGPPSTRTGATPQSSYMSTNSLPTLSENQISNGGGSLRDGGGGGGSGGSGSIGGGGGGGGGSSGGGGGGGSGSSGGGGIVLNLDGGASNPLTTTSSDYFQVPEPPPSSQPPQPSPSQQPFSLDAFTNDEEDFSLPSLNGFMDSQPMGLAQGEGYLSGGGGGAGGGGAGGLDTGYFQAPDSFVPPEPAQQNIHQQSKSDSDSHVGEGMGTDRAPGRVAVSQSTTSNGGGGGGGGSSISGGGGGGSSISGGISGGGISGGGGSSISGNGGGGFFLDDPSSSADTGYLPVPSSNHLVADNTGHDNPSGLEMFDPHQYHPMPLPPPPSSMDNGGDYGDDDDFDLPPLPDSMMGGGASSQQPPPGGLSYGGSIVALGGMNMQLDS